MGTLQDKIDAAGGALAMLRSSQIGQYVFPIAPEFSNWRDECEAWANTAVLLDQSHHMTDLYVEGPETIRLLADLSINNYKSFGRNKAKQIVACNHEGHVIGDAVLFGLDDFHVNIVGRPHVPNWVQYNAVAGGYDVVVERDERSIGANRNRRSFRFEVQGRRRGRFSRSSTAVRSTRSSFSRWGRSRSRTATSARSNTAWPARRALS